MLSWTQQGDTWSASGYRIELDGPNCWVLVDEDSANNGVPTSVSMPFEPLAVEPTLRRCKREARLIAAARHRTQLRRRYIRILLLTLGAAIFLVGESVAVNVLVGSIALTIGLRSLGVIVGTLAPSHWGGGHEIFFH